MARIDIHKNVKLLKHKLNKVETVPEGKSGKRRLAFAVDNPTFDDTIPILQRRHLELFLKRQQSERDSAEQKEREQTQQPPPKPKKTKRRDDPQPPGPQLKLKLKIEPPLAEPTIRCKPKKSTGSSSRTESPPPKRPTKVKPSSPEPRRKCRPPSSKPAKSKPKPPDLAPRLDPLPPDDDIGVRFESFSPVLSIESTPPPPEEPASSKLDSTVDTLVVREEYDEFAYLKDNESDEETTLSKNLKKIKSDTKVNNAPPKKQTNERVLTLYQKQETIIAQKQAVPTEKKEEAKIEKPTTAQDLEKFLAEKNWHLIGVELNHRLDEFKSNETARSVLKKAVMAVLDLDETFHLISLIRIVYAFEYPNDGDFWEMLIGKLKRKVSPHVQDHRYKCQADSMVVFNNYNIIIQEMFRHFSSSSVMNNMKLSFHLVSYLTVWGGAKELMAPRPQLATANNNPTALIQPMQAALAEPKAQLAIENNDPDNTFDVSLFKTANGKSVFKIRSTRRAVGFNPKLFG